MLLPLASFGFALQYAVDKWMLLRFYRKPPAYDAGMTRLLLTIVPWAVLIHLGFATWQFSSDSLPSGCATITGATSTTYKVVGLDYGKYLRLKVVGTNSLGADTKYSAATAKIAGIDPVNTVAPSISGTPKVGSTVTGARGTWTGVPTPTLSYQWFRCKSAGSSSATTPTGCTLISAATSSTYRLVAADKTAGYLRLRVTGTSAEGSAVRFSAAVKVQ
jgi:hypothetical protein